MAGIFYHRWLAFSTHFRGLSLRFIKLHLPAHRRQVSFKRLPNLTLKSASKKSWLFCQKNRACKKFSWDAQAAKTDGPFEICVMVGGGEKIAVDIRGPDQKTARKHFFIMLSWWQPVPFPALVRKNAANRRKDSFGLAIVVTRLVRISMNDNGLFRYSFATHKGPAKDYVARTYSSRACFRAIK